MFERERERERMDERVVREVIGILNRGLRLRLRMQLLRQVHLCLQRLQLEQLRTNERTRTQSTVSFSRLPLRREEKGKKILSNERSENYSHKAKNAIAANEAT